MAHYIKKEYFQWWIDFEGWSVKDTSAARLRTLYQYTKEQGYFDRIILYFTNIKREVSSHADADATAGSDILATLGGANFVGVNREPQRYNPSAKFEKVDQNEVWKHKARFFDPDSYYYVKFSEEKKIENKNTNSIRNAVALQKEINIQSNNILENTKLREYLKSKQIVNEHPAIFKRILH